jgi:hypothetical protein
MQTTDPGLSIEDRAHVVRLLHESENEFLELVSGLTDAQWTAAASDGWSVQHTAEHLVLGEKGIFAKIEEALAAPPDPNWQEQDARKTGFISRVLPDRGRKAAAPEGLHPHHNWTRDECIARYRAGRAKTIQFAEAIDRPMKSHLAKHPFPIFDMLNAYQWLLYIPLHNVRHNRQIAEALGRAVKETVA